MRTRVVGLALAVGSVVLTAPAAAQTEHPWLVRARAVAIVPQASSEPAGLDVKSDATIELDISRFLTPNIALELILATASQEVVAGSPSLGTVQHLPPTLNLQYHPLTTGQFRPYVGAGGNVTFFYGKSGGLDGLDLTTSVGYSFQAGADVALTKRAVLNFDGKYVRIATDVKSGGTKAYHLKINPLVIGVGLGYRF
jgi:outer membrane protein